MDRGREQWVEQIGETITGALLRQSVVHPRDGDRWEVDASDATGDALLQKLYKNQQKEIELTKILF